MPARVMIAIAAAVVIIVIGAVLLLPGGDDAPTVATETGPAATPDAAAFASPATATSGAGGVTAPAVPVPPVVDPTLAGDLAAFATARADGPDAPFAGLTADGDRIVFTFQTNFNGAEYDLAGERDVVAPGLEAFACDDGVCFEVTAAAIAGACADAELAALLQRGAVAQYRYVDLADAPLGDVTIRDVNCVR